MAEHIETKIIGLTGSIGMGKTTVASMFAEAGIPVQDADAVVHELLGTGGDAVAPLSKLFPTAINNDGNGDYINRKIMGDIVFHDSAKLKQLESILYPMIHQKRDDFIAQNRAKNMPAVVLDIPLLFENNLEKQCDMVCVVMADQQVRDARVLQRPNMTVEKLANIVAKQMDDAIKIAKADCVIRTDCDLETTRNQVLNIIGEFKVDSHA